MDGYKESGTAGFLKGVGQGSVGLVAKPTSGKPGLLDTPNL